MADLERIRIETQGMSDRELLLLIRTDQSEQLERETERNGYLADIMSDYYGDDKRKIKGTKPQSEKNTVAIDRGTTVVKTLMWVVSVIGVANLVALMVVLT